MATEDHEGGHDWTTIARSGLRPGALFCAYSLLQTRAQGGIPVPLAATGEGTCRLIRCNR